MKLNIVRISKKSTNADGSPLMTRDGRPYTRLGIQTREHGAKWLSGFVAPWNESWVEGQIIECEVKEVAGTDKDGKATTYLNISKPDPMVEFSKAVTALSIRIGKLEARIDALERSDATPPKLEKPTPAQMDEPPDEDELLPF